MTKKNASHLEHKLLVAMPHIQDEPFAKSVLYVYEHDQQGSMGFIINKPLPINMADILRQLNMSLPSEKSNELYLLQGGPVSKEQLYIVQYNPENLSQFNLVQPQDLLQAFSKGEQLENILPFLGYAGWGGGQLEAELMKNDWLICHATVNVFNKVPANERWEYCLKMIGIQPHHLSNSVGHA